MKITGPYCDLSGEQAQLILQIVSQLDKNAVTGDSYDQKCKFCNGETEAYTHSLAHDEDCVVLLIQQLRRTMLD